MAMIVDVNCWLVTGPGGARMDFIAGWLSTLPGFLEGSWRINPITGMSIGDSHHTKEMDDPNSRRFDDVLTSAKMRFNTNSPITYVGTCHGWYTPRLMTPEQLDAVRIIYIDTPHWNHPKICWEFVIKTFMTKMQTKSAFQLGLDEMNAKMKSFPNDEARAEWIHAYLTNFPAGHAFPPPPPPNATLLDYDSLFTPGVGSHYLAYRLGIKDLDNRHHLYYDDMLKYAESPKTIEKFGRIWQFSDYFNG